MATDESQGETEDSKPTTFGRYDLGESLGSCAFGTLSKGKVRSGSDAGRSVAIRVLDQSELDEDARSLVSGVGFSSMEVRDPKIAAVLDVVLEGSLVAIVSEWIDGVRLRDVLVHAATKGGECPPPVALRLAADLLGALKAASGHWSEIYPTAEDEGEAALKASVHGGLTADNVYVAEYGEILLGEVGVSGAAMSIESLRETVDALAHRAPEQLTGLADERSDVFTVGVILWELLAGRSLFGPTSMRSGGPALSIRSGSPVAAVRRKLEGGAIQRLDVLPRLKGKVSKGLADVVARATDREPKRRHTSLADLGDALRALEDEVGSPEDVAAYIRGIHAGASAVVAPSGPLSNRPTAPPEPDATDLQDRTTKTPSIPDIPAPPSEISSLLPPAPDADPTSEDPLSFVAKAKEVAARTSQPPGGAADDEAPISEAGIDLEGPPSSEEGIDLEGPPSSEDGVERAGPPDEVEKGAETKPTVSAESPQRDGARAAAKATDSSGPTSRSGPVAASAPEKPSSSRTYVIVLAGAALLAIVMFFVIGGNGDESTPSEVAPPSQLGASPPEPRSTAASGAATAEPAAGHGASAADAGGSLREAPSAEVQPTAADEEPPPEETEQPTGPAEEPVDTPQSRRKAGRSKLAPAPKVFRPDDI